MNRELKNAVSATDREAQYDTSAKRLLGQKSILAHILVKTVDEFQVVMIGLAKELPEHDETYELHRLLGALLSKELTVDEKLNIMEKEYDIPVEEDLREDVSIMCNLSQGIKEEGIAIGEAKGIAIGEAKRESEIVLTMHKNGFTAEQIASATDKDIEAVRKMITEKQPAGV